jgi:hypothetical protein
MAYGNPSLIGLIIGFLAQYGWYVAGIAAVVIAGLLAWKFWK